MNLIGTPYTKLQRFLFRCHSIVLGGTATGPKIEASGTSVKVPGLIVGSTTFSEAEFGVLDGVTPGTVTASKALVVDPNKDLGDLRNLDVTNLDAGLSGTAGTVDIFPATAAKGKATFSVADQAGDTVVTHRTAAMGQATTITTPDPGGAAASVVLTEGAQTINGVKTFGSVPVLPAGGLTAGATTLTEAELAKLDGLAATAYLPVVSLRSFTETTGAGTYTGSVTIPAGALLLDVKVWSTVLWDTLTSATMKVGDIGDDDGWFIGVDLKATDLLVGEELNFVQTGGKQGAYLDTTTGKRATAYSAAGTTLSGVITTVGATGSAGRTFMAVVYAVPVATAATKA